jgi:hypothetical protein
MSSLTGNLAELMFRGSLKRLYLVSDAFNHDFGASEATIKLAFDTPCVLAGL